ncbi:MAG TPA: hypothetical protein VFO34_07835 [Candidatus Acidoferrales bacterium]|nr:hypothetical protein [Candidatus Acidoferrales bacterium]
MKHLNEQQLVEYRYGDVADAKEASTIERHLHDCAECQANFAALKRVLETVDAVPVPEPDPGYETRVWNRLRPEMAQPARASWREWFTVRRLVPVASVAALIAVAFIAGRLSMHAPANPPLSSGSIATSTSAPNAAQPRERVLLVAVGDHLDRTQMVLMEISNAQPEGRETNISREQQRAEELLTANRLYRQTAMHTGDAAVSTVLDELEPVLLEIAHSPSSVSKAELDELQKHIEDRGLLLKVRVLDSTVRQKERATRPAAQPKANGNGTTASSL